MSELIQRAVRILEVLRVAEDGLSIRQIAEQAGLSKSTVQRLLHELVETDLAGKDPLNQRYRLGPRTLSLGIAYQQRLNIRQVALPHMTQLRDSTGETVGFTVGFGDQMMHIDQVESASELRAGFDLGRPLPLWGGAPSRLFLAERTEAEIDRILTQHAPSDIIPVNPPTRETMHANIRAAREDQYTLAVEETTPGVSTLSAPIRSAANELVATLSVTAPTSRLSPETSEEFLPALIETAERVSKELGWKPHR